MPFPRLLALVVLSAATLGACGAPRPAEPEAAVQCEPAPSQDPDEAAPRDRRIEPTATLVGSAAAGDSPGAATPVSHAGACEEGEPGAGGPESQLVCHWRDFTRGLDGGRVNRIQFDPRRAGRVFAVASARLYMSEDAGATWMEQGPAPRGVTELGFPGASSALLAGSQSGVLRSDDLGASWSTLSLDGLGIASLVPHPTEPLRVFAAVNKLGVLRSEDGGLTWSGADHGMPSGFFTGLGVLPGQPGTAMVGFGGLNALSGPDGTGGVARTDDGGNLWHVSLDGLRVHSLSACTHDPLTLWASQAKAGLARSEDGGTSWSSVSLAGRVTRVAAAGVGCRTVYAIVHDRGFFRSLDGGATWHGPMNDGLWLRRPRAEAIAVDPRDPDRVLIATHGAGFGSSDGGATWQPLSGLGRVTTTRIASSPAWPTRLWLSTWGSGVWSQSESDPGWQRVPAFRDDFAYAVEASPADAGLVIAGGWPEVVRSLDGAATFTAAGVEHNATDIVFHPASPDRILMATQTGGVWRSLDAGETWEAASGTLEPWPTPVGTFIDARSILHVGDQSFLGTAGRGLFVSDDFGDEWRAVAPSLASQSVGCLVDAGDSLFACVRDLGVHTSVNGETWSNYSQGLSSLDVRDLYFDDVDGALYAATSSGVFRRGTGELWEPLETECLSAARSLTIADWDGERLLLAVGGEGVAAYPLP